MIPLELAGGLAIMGAITAFWALRRRVWAITLGAVLMVLVGLLTIEVSRALPFAGPPQVPFILWAAAPPFSWASPDRDSAPRTYIWTPPAEMLRELRKGAPLKVTAREGKLDGNKFIDGVEQTPGKYEWVPLEPEHPEKDQ